MMPVQLLTYLELEGVQLNIDEGGLMTLKGRRAVLEPIIHLVQQHKPELSQLLTSGDFKIDAVAEALRFISNGLNIPPGHLLAKYFTPEDLFDISQGEYQNLPELRSLILSDPEYPFMASA
jgi:hypothetical protein